MKKYIGNIITNNEDANYKKLGFQVLKNKENSEEIKQMVFLKIWEINKEVFLWKKKRMKLFYLKIKE